MAKIKQTNAEGVEEEIEVFTPEEVKAKEDEYLKTVEQKDAAIANLAKEKSDLEAKIAKAQVDGIKEDHPNFKILKDALSKKDEEIKNIKTELDTDRNTRKQEEMDSAIKILAKGDVELEKKIKLNLEKTLSALPENTKEERQAKIQAALKLSVDYNTAGVFDAGIGGGGGGNININNTSTVEFTAREKALGAKLGISEDDYRKYSSRLYKK